MSQASPSRALEKASIYIFLIVGIGIISAMIFIPAPRSPISQENQSVTAQANAISNNGWAPLTVYFSAYGSRADGAAIARYEWDLDGNGAFDSDATAQGGYIQYSYSKPGDYVVTLRVVDALGRSATDQVSVSVRHPASSSVDYWTVFDKSRVRRIDVELPQADWDAMWVNPESKHQVSADVNIFGEKLEDVGFRMRGQFSLRESGAKKPWKFDIDAYITDQEFHNLRQLMLLNNIGDPSLLNEMLAYEMMYAAGMPASHTAFVELWIDITDDSLPSIYWGVYTMVERVDRKYIGNRFGAASKDGNLYRRRLIIAIS
jgi:hypothetical protein